MSTLHYTPTTYTHARLVADVCALRPFVDQRDVDETRVVPILAKFKADVQQHAHLCLDTPIVLLECAAYGTFLLDRTKQRVASAIVDGQHRVAALGQDGRRSFSHWQTTTIAGEWSQAGVG